ncbi:MAG: acyl-CoA dehydrogenase family protein [Planctomycetes bacterium]|nr:acyl-CoA dehydrogenase family protein [Planctomycetota bacterium]
MTASATSQKQIQEAEELLFAGPQRLGLAKGLFFGRFAADWVMPYPKLPASERDVVEAAAAEVERFTRETLDPVAIDRTASIPPEIISELGRLGVLGMTAPVEFGGRGFSLRGYCRVMEVIGGTCASTCVFINAHHSIGMRALLLFGTPEQTRRWMPDLNSGRQLAAFALTEPEAGSDAGNVQTQATPSPDGSHYVLNGQKRYITNGSTAGFLTVMARTPEPGGSDTAITAFVVTPDMPGLEIVEAQMEKLGIRGTTTSRLAFHNLAVPKENILGPLGKGLRVALTVLDFGRTTFGACCTGAMKRCTQIAAQYARQRRQFDRSLSEFELVKHKIAQMAAHAYAMEAMTTVTASLIDRGFEDYMLETAMLKVFVTEALWTGVNEAFQIHGGAAYFTDLPLERMLRDARINQIGEGANEVLLSFIALVGIRGPGQELKTVWEALHHPTSHDLRRAWRFGIDRVGAALRAPFVPVGSLELAPWAHRLGRSIRAFNRTVQGSLVRHGEAILDRQYVQERIARAAIELYASACTLSRWDDDFQGRHGGDGEKRHHAAELFLSSSLRRVRQHLAALGDNDDALTTTTADAVLRADGEI